MTEIRGVSRFLLYILGAFTLAGAVFQPDVKRLVENLWRELSLRPDAVGRS